MPGMTGFEAYFWCKKVTKPLSYTFFQAMTGFETPKKCKKVFLFFFLKIDF